MLRVRRPSPQALVTGGVVIAAVLFVFSRLEPSLLFSGTTPSGGDMGAHVWLPAYMRDHLLPHGRITGWTPDWYAGFPAAHFYFPLPSLLIVLLDGLLPYGVAFKLVSVLGLLALPVAAYAFGRLSRMAFPTPALLAVATVPFLFDRTKDFTIWGGNVASTLAGEFSFSIGLAIALVFLGVVARGLHTGRHRALAAGLLTLAGLCHVIPTLFALAGAGVLVLLRASRRSLGWVLGVFTVGGLLAGFWLLPFYARLPYANDMGWEKITKYSEHLFPGNLRWVLALAAAGAISAVALWRRGEMTIVLLAAVAGGAFLIAPEGRLWNARFLPFWYLCIYLLAAVAVAEACLALGGLLSGDPERPSSWVRMAAPVVGLVVVLMIVTPPLERGRLSAPGPHPKSLLIGAYSVATSPVTAAARLLHDAVPAAARPYVPTRLLSTTDSSFIPSWTRWNYSGYEGKPAYPEYRAIVDTMAKLPCGRAMWEYESKLDRYGTPMALMLLPYWTNGCIGSMEGLFFESSATTPYHFLNQAALSKTPSNPQRNLPYGTLDLDTGIRRLQLLGVRYYMASSPEALQKAHQNPDLRLVASSQPWEVFEVAGSDLVSPLAFTPSVVDPAPNHAKGWLDVGVRYYLEPDRWPVAVAAAGPPEWPRIKARRVKTTDKNAGSGIKLDAPPLRPVDPVAVSKVRTGDDSISFDVDRPGRPVLVKVSFFPNWQASGARGPWRVAPNLMVVVPTGRHVSLTYGYTAVDRAGWVMTILGLVGLVALARRPGFPEPPPPADVAGKPEQRPEPVLVGAES